MSMYMVASVSSSPRDVRSSLLLSTREAKSSLTLPTTNTTTSSKPKLDDSKSGLPLLRATSLSSSSSSSTSAASASSLRLLSMRRSFTSQQRERLEQQFPPHEREEQLMFCDQCLETGYDLVWNQGEYEQAVAVLKQALKIQQHYLGINHKDVGYTCNFIGTAYWLQKNYKLAMRYFVETRQIFCTAGRGNVKKLDQRIRSILEELQFQPEEIKGYEEAIQQMIEHKLQGDRFKEMGHTLQSREEYQKAKKRLSSFEKLL